MGSKLAAAKTTMVVWCLAALFGLLTTLPLIHATTHLHAHGDEVAASSHDSEACVPLHNDADDESDSCDACLALAFGKHVGADPIIRPVRLIFAQAFAEPAMLAPTPVIVRHLLPPPSRGPPQLI